jgi:Raf kinase inhibitor-like YbhB/YbcL family protein
VVSVEVAEDTACGGFGLVVEGVESGLEVVGNVDGDRESSPEDGDPETDGATAGGNDYGETGWGGPNPPDREHTYRFLLYALDDELDLPNDASKDDVYDAAEGNVVDKARIEGTYEP